MLVRELMTGDPVTVTPETSIVDAARVLLGRDVTAAPVVYETGHLVGIVSRRDLIAGRELEDPRAHLAPVHSQAGRPVHDVREVMTRAVVSVAPYDDSAHAAGLMIQHRLASLPVVDGARVVGMISVTDILRSHTHGDDEIAAALKQRFFEYGESHPLGTVEVQDGVVTIDADGDRLNAVIATAVAETTEGVVGVRTESVR
jgi:CBS domain-containing protein